jgi:acyl-CoA synthetase (AMP-forming)/AMP-acid ligase II
MSERTIRIEDEIETADRATDVTVVDALRRRATSEGNRIAYRFLVDGEDDVRTLSYAELDGRSRRVADALRNRGARGARALLLYEPGLAFIAALFGCFRAGVVAVPVYPPDPRDPGAGLDRIQAIASDADAEVVLTNDALWAALEPAMHRVPELMQREWCATDALSLGSNAGWQEPFIDSDRIALLQYTSGSTATPKGVMVSHRNIMAQGRGVAEAVALSEESVVVSWLPLYHDMGLVGTVLIPMLVGCSAVQMSPLAFLERPLRWLRALTRYGGTLSPAPNFAFDLCVRRTTPAERRDLDLSRWVAAMNGSEPVRPDTCERFIAAFAPYGFRAEALMPCYGLAEATLMVAGGPAGEGPVMRRFDGAGLARHRIATSSPGTPGVRTVVGSGRVLPGHEVRVVHPETARECLADEVGELWVRGACVAVGYWGRAGETAATFEACLETGEGVFLRTGDLGFVRDGIVFVTGRHKDLIVVHGRNLYPQDLERTAERAHPALRAGGGAAFVLDDGDDARLAIVHEIDVHEGVSADEIVGATRNAVARAHGLRVHLIVLIEARTLPKTSSGKVQRRACRAALVGNELRIVHQWSAAGGLEDDDCGASLGRPPIGPGAGAIGDRLVELIAELRDMPATAIHRHDALPALGVDSAEAAQLAARLEAWLARPVPLSLLLAHPTIESLAAALGEGSR